MAVPIRRTAGPRWVVAALGVAGLVAGAAGAGIAVAPAVAAAAASGVLTITGGTPQVTKAGTAFPAALVVSVTCGGTSVPGAVVTFQAPPSGPSATFTATGTGGVSVTTDATGSASASAVAGPSGGSYSVTATVASMGTSAAASSCGLPTGPQSFALTKGAVANNPRVRARPDVAWGRAGVHGRRRGLGGILPVTAAAPR